MVDVDGRRPAGVDAHPAERPFLLLVRQEPREGRGVGHEEVADDAEHDRRSALDCITASAQSNTDSRGLVGAPTH